MSTPDVTLVTNNLQNNFKWNITSQLGGSDHSPIIIDIENGAYQRHYARLRRKRWKRNKAAWGSFYEEVEDKMGALDDEDQSLTSRVKSFTDILIRAGHTHVGKTLPKSNQDWMTSTVRAAVKKRNLLRRDIANKRKEWLEACREATELAKEAKENAWREYLDQAEEDADPTRMWRTIKSLSGSPGGAAPNEAIIYKGTTLTSNAKKADAFADHYAGVSKLHFSKEERRKNLDFKKKMKEKTTENHEACKKIDMKELENAIKAMKKNGAPGPDDIPPSFLKNLGNNAKTKLLEIFNLSFEKGVIPGIWTKAVIIPILKQGKAASQISSYRPISLTSCVGKTLERIINNRLYYIAEQKGWISKAQAGFRKQRSCEDQILRITQHISDGFQQKPKARRTVMVLLDYSQAYDRVWREDLLLDMVNLGVPLQMVIWLRAFLNNRTAQVLYNGAFSRVVWMHQGLPQGSVISPLLFLFYINGLSCVIPDGVEHALFADDASICASDTDKNKAARKIQEALDAIFIWSNSKKMVINLSKGKTESTFFSPDPGEAKWKPQLHLNNKEIEFNPSPKFLGIHLDRTLAFTAHVKFVTDKVEKRNKILACLSSKSWGWKKNNMKRVYTSMQRSVLDYAAPAWQPWLSDTKKNKLEVAQNKALRLVTGQYASTPLEAVRLEADVESYNTHSKHLCAIAYEKAIRLDPEHPKHSALGENPVQHRSKVRSSWRVEAIKTVESISLQDLPRANIPSPFVKPWADEEASSRNSKWLVFPELPDPPKHTATTFPLVASNDTPWSVSLAQHPREGSGTVEQVIRLLDSYGIDTVIYTDGSCSEGTMKGGSAAVITTGSARNPVVLETIQKKGGTLTSSFQEEKEAMGLALNWMKGNQFTDTVICSDSQSLLRALKNLTCDTSDLRQLLDNMSGDTYIHWVPSHSKIAGNELADVAAKEATKLEGTPTAVSFSSAKSVIKRLIKDPDPTHHVVKETYKNINKKKEKNIIKSRKEAATLAQLRSGHCLKLAAYRHRIDDTKSDICPRCQEAAEDVKHWLTCPANIQDRLKIFGRTDVELGAVTEFPAKALAYAKVTFPVESTRSIPL